jgi:hypothetical protein
MNNSTMTQDLFVKPDFCKIDDDDDFTSFVEVASKSTYKDVLDKLMNKNKQKKLENMNKTNEIINNITNLMKFTEV